ncbi:MAG: 3-hydroxyacyl-CoA dehydrogenase, partial [Bacteroidetes bacterium]
FEIPLACHYRIAVDDPKLQIGLPEVKLGLLPGSGGTQRMPRLIGIEKALRYILQGTLFSPKEALKEGLIHEVVADISELIPAAKKYILENPRPAQPWDQKGYKIPGGAVLSPQGVQTFSAGAALLRKETRGNYPSAQYAMSCVYEGLQLPMERATTVEARYFVAAVLSPEAKNIIRTGFFAINKANKGAARPKGVPATEVKRVGVLGAGMMGAGIAFVSAKAGIEVVLKDQTPELAEKGKAQSEKWVMEGVKKGKVSPEKAQALLARISPVADTDALADCNLVIEAVFENRELKAQVTRETEAVIRPEVVFASNTSTLPITGLAQASARPEHFIGMHFFSPVDKMPLVEIITGEKTSESTLAAAIDFVLQLKKTPIVVRDSRGFFTSRVFGTFTHEGISMLNEGIPAAMIENAARDAGMPVGPLAVSDEVSLSLMEKIRKQTENDLGISLDSPAHQVVAFFVDILQRPGKKEGKGFYDYPEGQKKTLWSGLETLYPHKENIPSYEDIQKRLLHIMALETLRCLDEGVLRNAEDADVGSLLAFGFPAYTGGAISYIHYVGAKQFLADCERFAALYGPRFAPTESLRKMGE